MVRRVLLAALLLGTAHQAAAQTVIVPVLVPLTGFLAVEGKSQRNGAVLALQNPPAGLTVKFDVSDTGASPEIAVNAFERAAGGGDVLAVVAPMLGTQMLALLPLAKDAKVPLVTISGTAAITRQNNPWVFRFFPDDGVTKVAQVRYATEERGFKKPAVIYQTTAYGQSGHAEILALLKKAGIAPVYEDGLDVAVKDMAPVLAKARAAGADSLLVHLHGGPTALLVKAAATMGLGLPIIAGSGITQPSTTALLDPKELAGVCAETGSSPLSGETPAMRDFLAAYRKAFDSDPDAFSVAQYDATNMLLKAAAAGARTPDAAAKALAAGTHEGLAMTYKSNGRGDMAHSAVIVCFDRGDRVPSVVKQYSVTPGS